MTEFLQALALQQTRSPERQQLIEQQRELRYVASLKQLSPKKLREMSPTIMERAEVILSD